MIVTTHTRDHNGKIYDIAKLINNVKNRSIIKVPIHSIKGVSKSKKTGFSLKRLKNTDTKHPIIIDTEHNIIDGRHRVIKLKQSNATHVNAIKVSNKDLHRVSRSNRMLLVQR